jgi:hypothetical protein
MNSHKMIINVAFLFILTYILFYFLIVKKPLALERFIPNVFGNIDPLVLPGSCRPENNCFPGSYARTQIYQNVCQPNHGLLRQKIPLDDNCQRTFNDHMSSPKHHYVCHVDEHLQRRCRWI